MLRVCVMLTLWWSHAFALHEVYLKEPNKIPLYAQQTNVWCGAATAQMMLEGFPNDKNHVHPQKTIWNKIQTLKVESWYTDPDGLERVLDHYGTGTQWRAHCVKDSKALMRFMVANITESQYPVGALVYGAGHWISVIGATTDVHPYSLSGATLEKIEAHDPWKGQHVLVSGSTWFEKYWYKPVDFGKWRGCYLIVHEKSQYQRTPWAHIDFDKPTSANQTRFFEPAELKQRANQYLSQFGSELDHFHLAKLDALEPMLVRHERGDYYLVPMGDSHSGVSQGAVMINAHSGEWEGLSRFAEPHRYLSRTKALTGIDTKRLAQSDWIFSPSEQSRSPFHPALRLQSDRNESPIYVNQDGIKSTSLVPLMQ